MPCGARHARKASPAQARSAITAIQAGPRRGRPGLPQGPGLGTVGTRAARHAQGTAASSRQTMDRGAKAVPAAAEGGIRFFWGGRARCARMHAHDRAVPPHGGPLRVGLPAGPPARPDAPVAPGRTATMNRIPLPVRGRPSVPRGARLRHPARRGHEPTAARCAAHAYAGTNLHQRWDAAPWGVGHRGPSARRHEKGWLSGRITAGTQDVQSTSTRPGSGLPSKFHRT